MSRKAKLTDEQVWVVSNNVYRKPLKKYADEFGCSIVTLYNAKTGKPPYHKPYSDDFENEMVKKYFN